MKKHLINAAKHVHTKIQAHREAAGSWQNLLLRSSLTLTLTSGMSYVLGLVRDKTFAYTFGAGPALDIYNSAFVVPDFLFAVLVSGALAAAFVPIFTSLDETSRAKAIVYTNQVLSYTLILLSVFSVVFGIFLPYLAPYLVPGFDPAQRATYVTITRYLLVAPFFFTFSNTFGNALLSTKDFLWYGLAPVLYNVGIVIGIFILVPIFGLSGLVYGTVFGAALHMLIRAQAFWRQGFRPQINFKFSPELKETLLLMLPKMLQIGMWQIMLLWFILLASKSGEGSVTTYNFAYNFQSVPVSLIGLAIALASFANLSHLSAHKEYSTFAILVKKETIRILLITSAAAIALAAISHPLVSILLGGGKFTPQAVNATAFLISVYAFSVPLESLMHLLTRAHYALKNTWRPSLIHIGAILFSIALSGALLPIVGLYALPIAFSSGFGVQCIFLGISLWHVLKMKRASAAALELSLPEGI
ncbi:MAG: lipid II flippase MurJ [Candidatus Woesebacteria bacterium]